MEYCKINDKTTYNLYLSALFGDNSDKRNKLKIVLHKAIKNELTKRQIEVLDLYYMQNLNQKQIAKLLNIDKSAVSRHLSKAKRKLRTFLEYNIHFNS